MSTKFTEYQGGSSELSYDYEDLKKVYEDRWKYLHPIPMLTQWAIRANVINNPFACMHMWSIVEDIYRVVEGMSKRGEEHSFDRMLEIFRMPIGDEKDALLGGHVLNLG